MCLCEHRTNCGRNHFGVATLRAWVVVYHKETKCCFVPDQPLVRLFVVVVEEQQLRPVVCLATKSLAARSKVRVRDSHDKASWHLTHKLQAHPRQQRQRRVERPFNVRGSLPRIGVTREEVQLHVVFTHLSCVFTATPSARAGAAALQLSAAGDYVALGSLADLGITASSGCTVEAWVRIPASRPSIVCRLVCALMEVSARRHDIAVQDSYAECVSLCYCRHTLCSVPALKAPTPAPTFSLVCFQMAMSLLYVQHATCTHAHRGSCGNGRSFV